MALPVSNDEMVSARDFVRGYNQELNRLTEGEVDQIVLTRHGKLQAIVLTPERFEELLNAKQRRR